MAFPTSPTNGQTATINGIQYTYSSATNSWTLNQTTWEWKPPVPYPTDGKKYEWDEATLNWVLTPTL